MKKKLILGLAAVAVVVAGVAGMSAWEAHVINVTAHIENALSISDKELDFGTVFPQEYLTKAFSIFLSDSFKEQNRVNNVDYKIVQKPKPNAEGIAHFNGDIDAARQHCHTAQLPNPYCYLSLCPYLSKISADPINDGEFIVRSYYQVGPDGPFCVPRTGDEVAYGILTRETDEQDDWMIDLKVPPVKGYIGQDWPAGCPFVENDSQNYGCDLWIEVFGITDVPTEKELACIASGGTVGTSYCCLAVGDFPDTCAIGACGCAPGANHEVKVCNCPAGYCFDGNSCS